MTLGFWALIAVAVTCFAATAIGLKLRRFVGLTFRSRFIARREHEPWLYWSSLGLVIAFGMIALGMASLSSTP